MALPPALLHNELLLAGGLVAAALVGIVAARWRILGRLVQLAIWGGMLWLLATVIGERGRFDPSFGRIASLLQGDDQQVTGGEVRVRLSNDGHFWVRATIDGVPRRMLVDSGATVTALSTATAEAAALDVRDPVAPILLRTANGTISAATARVAALRFGPVVARDLSVVVSPAFGDTDVLGMNFLSKLKSWRVEDGTLILVPHHPQKARTPA